jgi:hypothetical protein
VADWVKDIAFVFAGGVVTTAGAVCRELWINRRKAEAVKAAIRVELREVAHRMTTAVYRFESRAGNLNRELLEWIRQQAQRYEGLNPREGILAATTGLLAKPDEEIATVAHHLASNQTPFFAPMEDARYTTTVVGTLHDLSAEYVQAVVDIVAHIKMFNENAEQSRHFLRLTFTALSSENHRRAMDNVREAEAQMAKRARIIADKITALELRTTGK